MEKLSVKKTGRKPWSSLMMAGLLLALPLLLGAGQGQFAAPVQLELTITGVKNNRGQIRISVFDKEKGFPSESAEAVKVLSVPARQGALEVTLGTFPTGTYAIALLHDENENGRLDTNLVGYPKEGYGVSNNKVPTFRAPSFQEAAFELKGADQSLSVSLRY